MRKLLAFAFAAIVAAATLSAVPAGATSGDDGGGIQGLDNQPWQFVTARLATADASGLREAGYELLEVRATGTDGVVEVDLIANGMQIAELRRAGAEVEVHTTAATNGGAAASDAAASAAARIAEATPTEPFAWKPWSGPGGLEEAMRSLADAYPDITKLVTFGQSVQGEDLLAIKVSANADRGRDGRKPVVMYVSLQHAREWIVGEVNLRLLHYYLENYGVDDTVTDIVDDNELWFVLVANPDGYDYTFTDDRLWRKNLADNDGDGEITTVDGVDLNRNWPFRWGYDNEGSSDDPTSATYRGPSPASEPETQAMMDLVERLDPAFFINYHSAAELLLYGNGWQVSTPEPDDNLHITILGDDADPAVPGYDPDTSAELYTTNGETTDHLTNVYGVIAYTPELDTCESAEDIFPDDAYGDDYCESEGRSVFEFPPDEALVQSVFEKNLPMALAIAQSADDPDDPVTVFEDDTPPDYNVDTFDVAFSGRQTVAVEARRSIRGLRMRYSINGGRERNVPAREWRGGEVYGDTGTIYYAEYRAEVRGANPGDEVTVWFVGQDGGRRATSEPFTYTVERTTTSDVLLLVNEDYGGVNPTQDATSPLYAETYVNALAQAGYSADVWDVTERGVPHDLAVLSHYDAVVWETGDNRLTADPEDELTDFFGGAFGDLSVSETQQFLTISVRDYLNEGGKLLQTGDWVGYFGQLAGPLGGIYYALNGDPFADCVVDDDPFGDCLIYSDDFLQYWQGAFVRTGFGAPEAATGVGAGIEGTFSIDGTIAADAGTFQVTSDFLPVSEFPQFASEAAMEYAFDGPAPYGPFSGEYYMGALHSDSSWMRLTQSIDVPEGATTATLAFQMSYLTEGGYDHVIIEAVTADGATTLPDENGGTTTNVPLECGAGFYAADHPFLLNYFSFDAAGPQGCVPTGATGEWNAFTGDSSGWNEVLVDLSAYAGSTVEVSISYVTDPAASGIGVFVDDTVVTIDGTSTVTDFEADQGAWTIPGPPEGSGVNGSDWVRSTALLAPPAAAVSTDDTITFAFGLEAIATDAERADLLGQALAYLASTP